MDMLERIEEVEKERIKLKQGGGPEQIEKQHKRGKLTARERIERLLDSGSFKELEIWSRPLKTGFDIDGKELPGDAVVTGYGKVNGHPIYVYAHDFTVAGGTQSAVQSHKVVKVMERAIKLGVPYIGIIDSGGIRIQDMFGWPAFKPVVGGSCTGDTGMIMYSPPKGSGVVPQISLMLGPCYAGSAYSPVMADFVFMANGYSYMSLASPQLLKAATFVDVTQEEIGSALLHAEVTGTCDVLVENDEEALDKCRELLSFLPSNNRERPPVVKTNDNPERIDEGLLKIVSPDTAKPYDMHDVIYSIVDNGHFFEIKSLFAKSIITGFGRLDGQTVGIVANNPMIDDGYLTVNTSDKEARFIRFCDAFNIPLVFLVDTPGYLPGIDKNPEGIVRHGAKVVYAICESTVPKITLYVRRCYELGHLAMGTERMGCDLVLGWPTAQLTRFKREGFENKYNDSSLDAASRQLIEDIIDPRETRPILINALQVLGEKEKPPIPFKKHGNMPM